MADQEDLGVLLSKIAVDVADLKKGLQDGRNELTSFKTMAEGVGVQVKKALTFTVGALGIGALLMEFKGLLQGVTEVGARLETIKLASYAVGQNFGYTSANVDLLATDLKKFKVATSQMPMRPSVNSSAMAWIPANWLPLPRPPETWRWRPANPPRRCSASWLTPSSPARPGP